MQYFRSPRAIYGNDERWWFRRIFDGDFPSPDTRMRFWDKLYSFSQAAPQYVSRYMPAVVGGAGAAAAAGTSFASNYFRPSYKQDPAHHLVIEPPLDHDPPSSERNLGSGGWRIVDEDVPDQEMKVPLRHGDDQYPMQPEDWRELPEYPDLNPYPEDDFDDVDVDGLPPKKANHAPHEIPAHGKYMSHLPHEMTVDLRTCFDTSGYRDTTNPRIYNFRLNRLWQAFGNLGAVAAGSLPDWAYEADRWNTLYSKHHVVGFGIRITMAPWVWDSELMNCCAYIDQGFYQDPLPLATLSDMSAWKSQPGAQSYIHAKRPNNVMPAVNQFVFDFPYIDCAEAFGPDVAYDNRLDEKNDGTKVILADSKDYGFHICWRWESYPADVSYDIKNPWTEVDVIQRVKFYDPVPNVN